MGSGIVSIALDLGHETTLSLALLAIALVVFALLASEIARDLACERLRLQIEARSPDSFTVVAATAVIAARLTLAGWNGGGEFLLVVAFSAWLALLAPVARHWTTPTTGASFLPVVATEALAVVASTLAGHLHAEVLAAASLAPFLIGLVLYPLVAIRFDLRQLLTGGGDHWIAGGALAVSTLAAAHLAATAHTLDIGEAGELALKHAAVALWLAAVLWLPVLVTAEVLHPRLRHNRRRWSSVFPVGMYCTCSIAVGRLIDSGAIISVARIFLWIALAVWLTTAVAEVRSLVTR
jgi:tellurite resistance protein TehA-like permease